MIKFRASSISHIMTDAKAIDPALITDEVAAIITKKTRTDAEKEILQNLHDRSLSAGAKTYIEDTAKEFVYGYNEVVSGKYMDKGLIVEDQSIELYNSVFFTSHEKNTVRKTNEWVTGECDILVPGQKIIDIKSAWSLATFPATKEKAMKQVVADGYDWQGRVYMMLWDVPEFEVAYCMVSTPDELIKYEQDELHYVDHIDEALRVTTVTIYRDLALEKKIKAKVEAARDYLEHLVKTINQQHNVLEAA